MTELKYDPELPFAVIGASSGLLYARFTNKIEATNWVGAKNSLRVVDTTPKPKIPEDAQMIRVGDPIYGGFFALRDETMGWWVDGEYIDSEEEFFEDWVEDRDITVLVEKEP